MALFERIGGYSNLFLYGGCVWTFFNHNGGCNGHCQANAVRTLSSAGPVYLYGTNVRTISNIVLEDTVAAVKESDNNGGWGGVVATYLHNAGSSSSRRSISASSGDGNSAVVTGNGLNWYSSSLTAGAAAYLDPEYYYCFRRLAANYPPFSHWMGFTAMFDLNQQTSMAQVESGPIQGDIWNAIVAVSVASKVDPRLILAIVMQEVWHRD
jgi:glucan 1,3-beta-glucosidase